MMTKLSCRILILCLLASASQADGEIIRAIGNINHAPLDEVSGITRSHSYPDTFWVHNDSGDQPRIFAINSKGGVIFPPFLSDVVLGSEPADQLWQGLRIHIAANQDWEDITTDGNVLYISDLGNNGNARRDLGVYVLNEPNPNAVEETRTLRFLPIAYPDQTRWPAEFWHFDSEAAFFDKGKLYFLTKHRQPGKIADWERGTKLYRLDTEHTDRMNILTKIEGHPTVTLPTAAEVSPDGKQLAVLCYDEFWLFDRPTEGDNWLTSQAYRLPLNFQQTGQVEAMTWLNNESIIFTNEPGQLFLLERENIPAIE